MEQFEVDEPEALLLDPEQSEQNRRRRRKAASRNLTCCWYTTRVVLLLVTVLLLGGIYMIVSKLRGGYGSPHRDGFFDATNVSMVGLGEEDGLNDKNGRRAVPPLIDHYQSFDIAVTIWMRGDSGLEEPLFSDIVIRDLRMTDKGVQSKFNFQLPISKL